MGRPVLVVTGRHRPHEIVLLLFALVTGLAYTVGAPPPRSAAAEMPPWLVDLWAIGLLAHGVIGLAGVLLPFNLERRLWLELGSMFIGTGALCLVAVVSFSYAGWAALLGGGLCVAWAVANQARAWQIYLDLRTRRGGG
jgi:hypothetical protein